MRNFLACFEKKSFLSAWSEGYFSCLASRAPLSALLRGPGKADAQEDTPPRPSMASLEG